MPRFLSAGFMITLSIIWLTFLVVSLSVLVMLGLGSMVKVDNWSLGLFWVNSI